MWMSLQHESSTPSGSHLVHSRAKPKHKHDLPHSAFSRAICITLAKLNAHATLTAHEAVC